MKNYCDVLFMSELSIEVTKESFRRTTHYCCATDIENPLTKYDDEAVGLYM
jgi:hypothetical protein